MSRPQLNSIVGITDFDEGTNLSCYLIQHGWNTEHATSVEEVLSDIEEGVYELVVIDEEMLDGSQWTLPDYIEAIGSDTRLIVLTEPGSHLRDQLPEGICHFLQHPYTYDSLRSAIGNSVFGDDEVFEGISEEEMETMESSDDEEAYDDNFQFESLI